MKKTLILLALGAVLILGGCRKKGEKPADLSIPPEILKDLTTVKFDSLYYNFGTIQQGDTVHREFKFTNTGNHNLIIARAWGSCGCTVPEYPKEPTPPGGTGVIKVTFNSAGKSGEQKKSVYLLCNTERQQEELYLKGFVETKTK